MLLFFCFFFFKDFIYLFLERREGGEKEREKHPCQRYIDWLPLARPQPGGRPTAQACALIGIEPVALWFAVWHPSHWAAPARAHCFFILRHKKSLACYSNSLDPVLLVGILVNMSLYPLPSTDSLQCILWCTVFYERNILCLRSLPLYWNPYVTYTQRSVGKRHLKNLLFQPRESSILRGNTLESRGPLKVECSEMHVVNTHSFARIYIASLLPQKRGGHKIRVISGVKF